MKNTKNKHDADKYYRHKRHEVSRCKTVGELIDFCVSYPHLGYRTRYNYEWYSSDWKRELNSKFKGNLLKAKKHIISIINEAENDYWSLTLEKAIELLPSPEEMAKLKKGGVK